MLKAWNSIAEQTKPESNKKSLLGKQVFISIMSIVLVIALTVVSFGNQLICIRDGNKSVILMTMSTDVNEVFEQAGVECEEGDEIVRNNTGGNYLEFNVLRAFNVKVIADGQEKYLLFTHGLVPDALDAAGVHMDSNDLLNVSPYTPLSEGMEITVDRVEYVDTELKEEIPYESITYERKSMQKGEKIWIQYGVKGERHIVNTSKYVNGDLVSTEEISNEVVSEPITEIIWIGTAVPVATEKPKETEKKADKKTKDDGGSGGGSGGDAGDDSGNTDTDGGGSTEKTFRDSSGNLVSYTKMYEGPCTAYTYNNGHNITASGLPAAYGRVAVDPNMIPYGTKMYIVSPDGRWDYGYCVAADTGSFAWNGSGTLVDLFYESYNTCIQFGRRSMKIYIL